MVIGERGVEILQPLRVGAAEIAVAGKDVGARNRLPAERACVGDGFVELFRATQRTGWRDERDAGAGGEQWRKSHRAQRRERFCAVQWGCAMRSARRAMCAAASAKELVT
jgi:hypothetical protein